MPRKLIERYLPDPERLRQHKHLRIFGSLLHDPSLWHLHRRNVSMAVSVGLFGAFIPVPFQMILAAAGAIVLRANLPISVALVWLTNPLTMPPIFYGAYKLGAWMLQSPPQNFAFELSFDWLTHGLEAIWQPFLLGCFTAGIVAAVCGNILVRILWRRSVAKAWKARRASR